MTMHGWRSQSLADSYEPTVMLKELDQPKSDVQFKDLEK